MLRLGIFDFVASIQEFFPFLKNCQILGFFEKIPMCLFAVLYGLSKNDTE